MVNNVSGMYVIGLTGGIGSGKSTVAGVFEDLGAAVLSADLLGHEVYLPGRPAYNEIVAAFGPGVVAADGTIDRKKLGPIVFSDPANLAKLNAITHPRMHEMMRERLAEIAARGVAYAVLEAALLFDAGWDDLTDEVWVTVVPPNVAAERTAARSGIPVEQVLERIQKAQMESDERVRRSDLIIDTSGTLEETVERARAAWEAMRKRVEA
jgi:dephospho-CoA kinase